MSIVFSDHALLQIKQRQISKREVRLALKQPLKEIDQGAVRSRAVGFVKRGGRRYLLIVVYDRANGHREIVTAFLTSQSKKYL